MPSGDCYCLGNYHGGQCELDGCTQYSGASQCSGFGDCVNNQCICNSTYYGAYCEKYDWIAKTITFTEPQGASANSVQTGSAFTVKVNQIDSNSTGVLLYVQYVYNLTDITYENWTYLSKLTFVTSVVSYTLTIPASQLSYGTSAYAVFLARDLYYLNIIGMANLTIFDPTTPAPTPTPTPAPTTIAPTLISGGGGGSTSFLSTLQSSGYFPYIIVIVAIVVLAIVATIAVCCINRKKRGLQGHAQLMDTPATGIAAHEDDMGTSAAVEMPIVTHETTTAVVAMEAEQSPKSNDLPSPQAQEQQLVPEAKKGGENDSPF